MNKKIIIAAVLACAAMLSASCSSSEDTTDKTSEKKTSTTFSSAEAAETTAADTEETTAATEPEVQEETETAPETDAASQAETSEEGSSEDSSLPENFHPDETVDERLQRMIVDAISPPEWDYDKSELKVKNVGDDKFGTMDIPEDWHEDEAMTILSEGSLLTYVNDEYDNNGTAAIDCVIIEKFSAKDANSKMQDMVRKSINDVALTEISIGQMEIDGKNAGYIDCKYENINKLQKIIYVSDDAETTVYSICIESSNPNVIDLYKTYKRPAAE